MVDRLSDKQVKEYREVFEENKNEKNEVEYRHKENMLTKLELEYRAVFEENKNEKNEVEYRHIENMLTKLGLDPSSQQLEEIYEELDVYCDGSFTFPHFLQLMVNKFVKDSGNTKKTKTVRIPNMDEDLEKEMREAFRVFDGDGNGFISQAELKHALFKMGERMTDEEIEEMMEEADKDGDGQISFPEFCAMMPNP